MERRRVLTGVGVSSRLLLRVQRKQFGEAELPETGAQHLRRQAELWILKIPASFIDFFQC